MELSIFLSEPEILEVSSPKVFEISVEICLFSISRPDWQNDRGWKTMNCSDTFENSIWQTHLISYVNLLLLIFNRSVNYTRWSMANIASTFYLAIAGVHREKYIAFVFFYTDIRIEFLEIHTINHICICALNILIDKNMLESKNTGNWRQQVIK